MTKYYAIGLSTTEQDRIRKAFNDTVTPLIANNTESIRTFRQGMPTVATLPCELRIIADCIGLLQGGYQLTKKFENLEYVYNRFVRNWDNDYVGSPWPQTFIELLRELKKTPAVDNFLSILLLELDSRFSIDEYLDVHVNVDELRVEDIIEYGKSPLNLPLYLAPKASDYKPMLNYIVALMQAVEAAGEEYDDCLDLLTNACHEELKKVYTKGQMPCRLSIFFRLLQENQVNYAEELLIVAEQKGYIKELPEKYQYLYQQLTKMRREQPCYRSVSSFIELDPDSENNGNTLQHFAMSNGRIHYNEQGHPTDLLTKNKLQKLPHQYAFQDNKKLPKFPLLTQATSLNSLPTRNLAHIIRPIYSHEDLRLMMTTFRQEFRTIDSSEFYNWDLDAKVLFSQWLFLTETGPFMPFSQRERIQLIVKMLTTDYHPSQETFLCQVLWFNKFGHAPATLCGIAKSVFQCDAILPFNRFITLLNSVELEPKFRWIYLFAQKLNGSESTKFFDSICKILLNSPNFRAAVMRELAIDKMETLRVLEAAANELGKDYHPNDLSVHVPSLLNYVLGPRPAQRSNYNLLNSKVGILVGTPSSQVYLQTGQYPETSEYTELLNFYIQLGDLSQKDSHTTIIDGFYHHISQLKKPSDIDPRLLAYLKVFLTDEDNLSKLLEHRNGSPIIKTYENFALLTKLGLISENSRFATKLKNNFVILYIKNKNILPYQPILDIALSHLVQAYNGEHWYKEEYGALYEMLINSLAKGFRVGWDENVKDAQRRDYCELTRVAEMLFTPGSMEAISNEMRLYKALEMICGTICVALLEQNQNSIESRNILGRFLTELLELLMTANKEVISVALNRFEMTSNMVGRSSLTNQLRQFEFKYEECYKGVSLLKNRMRLFPANYPFAKELLDSDKQTPEVKQARCEEFVYNLKC